MDLMSIYGQAWSGEGTWHELLSGVYQTEHLRSGQAKKAKSSNFFQNVLYQVQPYYGTHVYGVQTVCIQSKSRSLDYYLVLVVRNIL